MTSPNETAPYGTSPNETSPSAARRRCAALGVPALVLLGAGLFTLLTTAFAHDTFHDCHYFGPSLRMHITAWAALACGLAAPALHLALRVTAARRGRPAGATTASAVAAAFLLLGLLPLFFEVFGVWSLYAPDPSGGHDCSGLAHPLADAVPYAAG